MLRSWQAALLGAVLLLTACASSDQGAPTSRSAAISEVAQRPLVFTRYPQPGRTYLSFSKAHGFQVNYIAPGNRAWLWYPGNARALPEEYRIDTVAGRSALCWRHPQNSYNPVTQTTGGDFACEALDFARRTVVAVLSGDPFDLRSGRVPYRLERCAAPPEFRFDRDRFGC